MQPELKFAVLATDTAVFRVHEGRLELLLVPVVIPQFAGKRGLPGGLIAPVETAEAAALRHLQDKAGLQKIYLEQLYTFSRIDRDPRGRVVSVGHLGLVPPATIAEAPGAEWVAFTKRPALAYDHDEIVRVAHERLSARIGYTTIIRYLLPREFTLTELQQAYEIILERNLDKRNFRKKIQGLGLLAETGRKRTQGASRPAELYRFKAKEAINIEILYT